MREDRHPSIFSRLPARRCGLSSVQGPLEIHWAQRIDITALGKEGRKTAFISLRFPMFSKAPSIRLAVFQHFQHFQIAGFLP